MCSLLTNSTKLRTFLVLSTSYFTRQEALYGETHEFHPPERLIGRHTSVTRVLSMFVPSVRTIALDTSYMGTWILHYTKEFMVEFLKLNRWTFKRGARGAEPFQKPVLE